MITNKLFILGIAFLFLVSLTSASFQVGVLSHNITTTYSSGDFVKGWMNLSFSDEDFNSTFVTNRGDSITLFNLLKSNSLITDCDAENCDIDYEATNQAPTKTISLVADEEKLVGIKITENVLELNSMDFAIRSSALQSCYNQIKIDVLDDGDIDISNANYSKDFCALFRTKGCFDENHAFQEVILSNAPICQRVELPESGGFRLGAELIGGVTKKSVDFGIYNLDGSSLGSCANNSVIGNGEFFCDVDGFVSEETKEYYVCATSDFNNNIRIKSYQTNDGCGFSGIPPKPENYSYNIIAYSKQFGNVGNFSISNKYSGSFLQDAQNYLISKYGNLDCAVKNCVVPMRVFSKVSQDITFENFYGTAVAGGGVIPLSNYFYDLTPTPMKYDSSFSQIYLDNANFIVGDSPFILKLNSNNIFSQEISVKKIPLIRSLNPTATAAAVETEFVVNLDSVDVNSSINNYHWDFGNGDSRDTKTNSVSYTYNNTGSFNLNLTITTIEKLTGSKSFKITVETPIKAVNTTLSQKLSYLNKLKTQIETFSAFHQTALNTALNLVDAQDKLTKIKINFDSAVPGVADSYYVGLMQDLLKVIIPTSISVSKSADLLPFYFTDDKINLNALELLSGNYSRGREADYKNAILSWNINNLVNTITYKEISADYGDGLEVLLNVFEITMNKKPASQGTSFLIIKKLENLNFEKDYGKREIGEYFFIPLDEASSKVVFSTTEDISFSELPIFISPQLSNLQIPEESKEETDGISKWIFFGLILFLLVLIAIAVYIILQKWYSKKYEDYLFKNKNDLYNLISFIENSKKKGIEEDKIVESLRKAGWNSEQMRYILRKYLGKHTGMFEIPVEKVMNIFKKKQINVPAQNVARQPAFRNSGFNPRRGVRRF